MNDLRMKIKQLYERNPNAKNVINEIHSLAKRLQSARNDKVDIMNFCGTHEWTITYYGIRTVMPELIDLIAGPGCPVCVTPGYYVEVLAKLSFEGYHILTYGDAYKLPSTIRARKEYRSLAHARSFGGKVTIVYSFLDAVKHARESPSEDFIFFAIGFETTMPSTAELLIHELVPKNLLILSAYRLTPPIMEYLLSSVKDVELDGIIAPGHVSAVIGARSWEFIPRRYGIPTVVSGFEPVDVLISILMILKQLVNGKAVLMNEYVRVVKPEGSHHAKKVMSEVYDVIDSYWRGIGKVPMSGAVLKKRFRVNDALYQLGIKEGGMGLDEMPGCRCSDVVLGRAKPTDCPLFLKVCTPEKPYGPCMVSSEGTCRIWAENYLILDYTTKRATRSN